jgi:hypothetical protein
LFKYLPGKDWPLEVKHKIDMMRQKNATDTFIARNKTALQGKTPREKNEVSFGSAMVYLLGQLVPTVSSIWYPMGKYPSGFQEISLATPLHLSSISN